MTAKVVDIEDTAEPLTEPEPVPENIAVELLAELREIYEDSIAYSQSRKDWRSVEREGRVLTYLQNAERSEDPETRLNEHLADVAFLYMELKSALNEIRIETEREQERVKK